jgi:hypothetical protein
LSSIEPVHGHVYEVAFAGAVLLKCRLLKPVGLEALPAANDHFLGRRIRVRAKRELLCQQLGSEGRQRAFLALAVFHDGASMFIVQRGQQRV